MLMWIAQNKYKLMAFIIGLYLMIDVLQHKGQTRVLFPVKFPEYKVVASHPQSKSTLINQNKHWKKGINSIELLNGLSAAASGFECDVYFDTSKNIFDVHHDPDKSIGLGLANLLEQYQQNKMTASIWLDIKNLNDANSKQALISLIQVRNKYGLQNKILAESNRADLLTVFSDSGFYTSYYTPVFNPYQINKDALKLWADSISFGIKNSRVNALSGYYFQSSFFNHYFPRYPVLIWGVKEPFSLVNRLFRMKIANNNTVYIALYP